MIKMLAETKASREKLLSAAEKIARNVHVSRRTALAEFIPLLRVIYRLDRNKAAYIMKSLNISPDEAVVITGEQEARQLLEKKLSELAALAKKQEKTSKPESKGYKPAGQSRESSSKHSRQRTLF
jgi:hypothetical protein